MMTQEQIDFMAKLPTPFSVKSLCEFIMLHTTKGVINLVAPDIVKIYVPTDVVQAVDEYTQHYKPSMYLVSVGPLAGEVDLSGIAIIRGY